MSLQHILGPWTRTGRLLALGLLAACAQTGTQKALDEPVNQAHLGLPAGETAAVSAQWWRQLHQAPLTQLMARALAQAPDVRVAQARLRAADAQWRAAEGRTGLQIGAKVGGNAFYLSPQPQLANVPQDGSSNFYQASAQVQASYVFDFWGKQKNTVQAALGQRRAAALQIHQAQLMLAQAVVAQYTQWQLLTGQSTLLDKRIAVHEAQQKLQGARARAGLLPGSALYASQQTVLQLQAAQKQMLAQLVRVRHSLAALSGQPPSILDGLTPPPLGTVPHLATGSLKADVLGRRPDIAAQRAVLQSRYHSVAAAKAAFYPNIEIKALAGLFHVDAFDLLRGNSRLLGLMPALSLPIFTSGSLRADLAGKNAQYDEQVALYDKTVLGALQQAADAVNDYQSGLAALPLQRQSWQLAQKRAAASARRVRAGLDNGIERLQQEDAALAAQSEYLTALAYRQHGWNNVQAALGGGFQAADSD